MAKKNTLREVKSISSIHKTKIKDVFAHSDYWEAWELCGDDENDPDNWSFLADGSFEECLRGIKALITIELEYKIREENNMTMRENPQWFLDELKKRHELQVEVVKRECFQKGQYIAPYWSLRSMLNREQCEYIAKHGNPCPNIPHA
ncbi:MAG: hypothetical protein AAFW70_02225 [Cyanobacteria bacterium J06635_10]